MTSASAAEFTVENLSNQRACGNGSGLLGNLCGGFGPATLQLTITTAPNEFKLQCDEQLCSPGYDTYIIAAHKGLPYVMGSFGSANAPIDPSCQFRTIGFSKWQVLPANIDSVQPTFPWSLPFSSLTVSGKVDYTSMKMLYLDETYGGNCLANLPFSELEIYAGISPIGQKVFTPDTFKKIWPQP